MTTKPGWTDAMNEAFKAMFLTHSYGQIGRAMTKQFNREFTASAIAGHAHRNGFAKGRPPAKVKPPKPERKKKLKVVAPPQPLDDVPPLELDFTAMTNPCWNGTRDKSVSLLELNDDSCRFPQDVDGEARWCGAAALGVYCSKHSRIAYRAPSARKARPPAYRIHGR
jgi:hypothetical protein